MLASESSFHPGETVRIKAGAFSAFIGRIERVDDENLTLEVRVTIFGRAHPVNIKQQDAEKIKLTNSSYPFDNNFNRN
ncbi:MAG: KOW motif-containing protein [Pyrinomonadaceae bacterium]|nr:KOW motif-containing protein [Pyrinomonadaceae bacterium]